MLQNLITKVVGKKSERQLKRLRPLVAKVGALEAGLREQDDAGLRARTADFRQRVENGESPDDLMPEAFAVCREGARRTLGMRHFDVQLLGGAILHQGRIAEMKTGEGKTLVATLAAYLNALTGKGVHVVTVNDYLARRDSEWMGRVYRFLGLEVGVIQHDLGDDARRAAYAADITYGTNNEFGFDYLRDNMKFRAESFVHRIYPKTERDRDGKEVERLFHFAIVDEVDSILVDEARTPLIISGPAEDSADLYYTVDRIIPRLRRDRDYTVDEKSRSVTLTEEGVPRAEELLRVENLYDPAQMTLLHHLLQALRAHALYKREKDYTVKENKVVIVDEFTGRLMPGRRWSDGLHQAVEAKEGVKIERENQTLATITFQNYFRMYGKLAGMTGTAETEAAEFEKIYELEVVPIPTNRPLVREEYPDVVYRTEREKLDAIAEEIGEERERGRPVLVGTTSIEKSERLARLLKRRRIPHVVLNAKYHQREAEIVAQAGRSGAVTIATNMAGRGTDILLGGNSDEIARARLKKEGVDWTEASGEEWEAAVAAAREETKADHDEVVGLGGLHIVGTERHEARRIDNQLRGRAGRQGDPGSSRFFLSLEDDLMRIFGSDRMSGLMQRLGMEEGVPIEAGMVTRAIERAQKQVEAQNFSYRKHLLEYDDVMNRQRVAIYGLRRRILEGQDQRDYVLDLAALTGEHLIETHLPTDSDPDDWDMDAFREAVRGQYGFVPESKDGIPFADLGRDEVKALLAAAVPARYEEKEREMGSDLMRVQERYIMLHLLDAQWKDHLYAMDHLKQGIGLRGYGQRDPLIEYKKESFSLFEELWDRLEREIVRLLFVLKAVRAAPAPRVAGPRAPAGPVLPAPGLPAPGRPAPGRPAPGMAAPGMAGPGLAAAGPAAPGLPAGGGLPAAAPGGGGLSGRAPAPPARRGPRVLPVRSGQAKVGRNDPCPCGSGKKYKKCHAA